MKSSKIKGKLHHQLDQTEGGTSSISQLEDRMLEVEKISLVLILNSPYKIHTEDSFQHRHKKSILILKL
jgi:hypothetical protein